MAVYEGVWDCTSCGTKAVRGALRACSACGAPRADDVKFYLPQGAQALTDAGQVREAKAGEDWYCEHCGAGTGALLQECRGCGAPRGSSKAHSQAKAEEAARRARAAGAAAPAAGGGAPVKVSGAACLVLAVLAMLSCCCLAFLGRPSEVPATIAARTWERAQDVEAYRTVVEEGWEVPGGARVKREERRVHHHDRVLDHTERRTRSVQVQTGTRRVKTGVRDLGNGHFEDTYADEPVYGSRQETYDEPIYRQEPVYRTYSIWEIDRWVTARTERASGTDDEPRWPEVRPQGDKERAGARREAYQLVIAGPEGKSWTYACDEARWRAHAKGEAVVAVVSGDEVKELRAPDVR